MLRILIIAAVFLAGTLPGYGQTTSQKQEGRIRYKPGWVEATCQLEKLDFVEAERRKDARRSFFDRPYPKEIEIYVPGVFEYAEHILTGIPCYATPEVEIRLSERFRCRLDRVIFRDPEKGEELKATGGNYSFHFVYRDSTDEKVEDRPRALRQGPPGLVGQVLVRGQLAGKTYTITREWMQGSPAEATGSRETQEANPDDAILASDKLPFVTASNASMFVFDLRNDSPIVKELTGGPLKEYQFIPHSCQG
ncbi:hypothetical protein [Microvirga calopogonii]|uniref:hypothetical protein n=1 Tax=Microvirga calopogonii TaxID=2078013 RepID=UPI000E0D2082|nr:hypothetical protein [Microvirga calopogonii]